jgi:hypothetical protein
MASNEAIHDNVVLAELRRPFRHGRIPSHQTYERAWHSHRRPPIARLRAARRAHLHDGVSPRRSAASACRQRTCRVVRGDSRARGARARSSGSSLQVVRDRDVQCTRVQALAGGVEGAARELLATAASGYHSRRGAITAFSRWHEPLPISMEIRASRDATSSKALHYRTEQSS